MCYVRFLGTGTGQGCLDTWVGKGGFWIRGELVLVVGKDMVTVLWVEGCARADPHTGR